MIGPKRKKRTRPQTEEEWWDEWHENERKRRAKALSQMSMGELTREMIRRLGKGCR